MKTLKIVAVLVMISFLSYCSIGTSYHVDEIKKLAPKSFSERGWELMRYEGFEYGAFKNNGGKVWYHVRNISDHSIQYRVYVTMWNGELQYYYGEPEKLERTNIDFKN